MNLEHNKVVVRRYIEMWNTGDITLAPTVLATTYVDYAHPEVTDLQIFTQTLQQVRTTFPDFHIMIDTMIAEAEWVAVRATIRRTQQDQLRVSHVIWFVRIQNGRMVGLWTGTEAS